MQPCREPLPHVPRQSIGDCPCEGLAQGVATWGSSFPTARCLAFGGPTEIILFDAPDDPFRRLAALGGEFQFNCNVWDGSPQANAIPYMTAAGAEACAKSLIAIAAEDGVVCN